MKKSSIFATVAVIGSITILAAANFKIKSEYTKGNIQSAYDKTKLQPFKYIRENVDSSANLPFIRFKLVVNDKQVPSVQTYFVRPPKLSYTVIGDTLVISRIESVNDDHTNEPIIITTPSLLGLQTNIGEYDFDLKEAGTLSISAVKKSKINIDAHRIGRLALSASGEAVVSLSVKDPVEEADIRISNRASLQVNNVLINRKTLQLDSTISLQLKGRSVADFGVTGN